MTVVLLSTGAADCPLGLLIASGSILPGVRIRAGEPLRRATLSQSLYPELSIRSFSKLDQTDHIGRWDGAEFECVGPKLEYRNRMKRMKKIITCASMVSLGFCASVFLQAGSAHADLCPYPGVGPASALCSVEVATAITRPRSTDRTCIARPVVSAWAACSGLLTARELRIRRRRNRRCELHVALPRRCDITGTQPARVVEGIHGGDELD